MLLLWWGSFKGGGGTLGDYHAVRNLADRLAQLGLPVDIMSGAGLDFGPHRVVGYKSDDPHDYRAAVFVCGPIVLRGRVKRLLRRYRCLPIAAVGVSLIDPRPILDRWFDAIVERDSDVHVRFDLAMAADVPERPPAPDRTPAICLRGKQSEYGAGASLSDAAEAMILAAVSPLGAYRTIDTVLRPDNPVDKIEAQFAETSILLTTRLHGAIFALLNRIPFIAVDQIRGGAKVSRLLQLIRYPSWAAADRLDAARLAAMAQVLDSGWTDEMEAARSEALRLSKLTLEESARCIAALARAD